MRATLHTRLISSLEKCFHDEAIESKPVLERISMLRGQRLSFQLAYTECDPANRGAYRTGLRFGGDLAPYVTARAVVPIPSTMPTYPGVVDDNYLRTEPGLYPDLLAPLSYHGHVVVLRGQLRALWLDLELPDDFAAGEHVLTVELTGGVGEALSLNVLRVTLVDAALPPQELIFTQWFHCDSLAHFYGVEAFSEQHWAIIERFVRTAVKNGINLLLTPTFTPALDTYVGGERMTTQLVDVTLTGEPESGSYTFTFDRLDRWIEMCDRCGVKYLEIAHFFTQWGAMHAPKVMATVDGEYRRLFGWETDATGPAYTRFLRSFIPAFLAHMKARGDDRRCYFHISDEPNAAHLESYRAAKAVVADLLAGYPIMDALSNYEYYQQGVVEIPIPSSNHIEPFLAGQVPGLWTYYCCSQHTRVSNRFFAMPSARNRIIGVQMYKFQIAGFLQWGYNFYANQGSHEQINPFLESTGEGWVPSGDAYSVYPAPTGEAWESLRIIVFHEALEDLRALRLCESLYDRSFVMNLIEDGLDAPITFSEYPHDAAWLLRLRERVNAAIAAKTGK